MPGSIVSALKAAEGVKTPSGVVALAIATITALAGTIINFINNLDVPDPVKFLFDIVVFGLIMYFVGIY